MRVLLVEPNYYTRYPPLGLLKLSTYHKQKGDEVVFVRGNKCLDYNPEIIYVTSLFTWTWEEVWQSVKFYKNYYPGVEIQLGGIYASLLPQHAKLSGADIVHEGTVPYLENLLPDYTLVPEWNSSVLFATRGCPRKCGFCSVPKLEGPPLAKESSIRELIHPDHKKIVFFDNNVLGLPESERIFTELAELGLPVDFNQGMDVRYMSEANIDMITSVKMPFIRMAFDYSGIRPWVEKGIELLVNNGVRGKSLVFYVLYNYIDDPEDFFLRIRDLLNWGVVCYPMRYEPLCTLKKGEYVSPGWDVESLDMVQAARRVIGYGGAFPPYQGLVDKFNQAKDFKDAFGLREVSGHSEEIPSPIVEMAMEHQHQDSLNGFTAALV